MNLKEKYEYLTLQNKAPQSDYLRNAHWFYNMPIYVLLQLPRPVRWRAYFSIVRVSDGLVGLNHFIVIAPERQISPERLRSAHFNAVSPTDFIEILQETSRMAFQRLYILTLNHLKLTIL